MSTKQEVQRNDSTIKKLAEYMVDEITMEEAYKLAIAQLKSIYREDEESFESDWELCFEEEENA